MVYRIYKYILLIIIQIGFISSRLNNPNIFLMCNQFNCPKARGICTRDNKCICKEDFLTVKDKKIVEEYGNFQCNYPQANQAKVFLMEFVIGFGIGHFYLGNFLLAGIKFLFGLFTIILVSISPCLKANQMNSKVYNNLVMVFGLLYIMWQALDGILIGLNIYKDRNGIKMKSSWDSGN